MNKFMLYFTAACVLLIGVFIVVRPIVEKAQGPYTQVGRQPKTPIDPPLEVKSGLTAKGNYVIGVGPSNSPLVIPMGKTQPTLLVSP